jgi:hypothetical protein
MKRTMVMLVVVLAAGFAVTAQADTAGKARSESGRLRRNADVTFTKWVTSPPDNPPTLAGISMAGVVGGDVGQGTYTGMVISDDRASKPGFWLAQALYGFRGSEHTFVAHNLITEDDTTNPITGTIRGFVTSGWMMGARVTGEYTLLDPCPIPTPGNVFGSTCFQGTLHLQLARDA